MPPIHCIGHNAKMILGMSRQRGQKLVNLRLAGDEMVDCL